MPYLLGSILAVGYVWMGLKFWNGFRRTNFEPSLTNRIALTLLWPALLLVNPSYRRNFQKALRGR